MIRDSLTPHTTQQLHCGIYYLLQSSDTLTEDRQLNIALAMIQEPLPDYLDPHEAWLTILGRLRDEPWYTDPESHKEEVASVELVYRYFHGLEEDSLTPLCELAEANATWEDVLALAQSHIIGINTNFAREKMNNAI